MDSDIIILGGGVLGVSLAYHLSAAGMTATLIEREALPGTHASGRNAGMVRQLYRNAQLTEWASRSIATWPQDVRRRTFRQTGSLVVGRKPPGHHAELFQENLIPVTRDGRIKSTSAVYTATDGLLDSPGYVNALYALCDRKKIKFHFKETATAVFFDGSRFEVRTESGKKVVAPMLVNACGAWVNEFPGSESNLPAIAARPFARHLFVVEGFSDNFMPDANCGFYWDEEGGWYMRQWDPHTRLISICDAVAATPETFTADPMLHERLSRTLLGALPEIAKTLYISRSWHCFRTYAEDQLPVWGTDSRMPGLFWLAAFGGFGMSTSFAAAADAANVLSGKTGSVSDGLKQFSPDRLESSREVANG